MGVSTHSQPQSAASNWSPPSHQVKSQDAASLQTAQSPAVNSFQAHPFVLPTPPVSPQSAFLQKKSEHSEQAWVDLTKLDLFGSGSPSAPPTPPPADSGSASKAIAGIQRQCLACEAEKAQDKDEIAVQRKSAAPSPGTLQGFMTATFPVARHSVSSADGRAHRSHSPAVDLTQVSLFGPNSSISSATGGPSVQRQSTEPKGDVDKDVEDQIRQSRGQGQPLANPVKEQMEGAIGANFSSVRVHTDAQADGLNQSLQAKAFTTRQNIYFRSGAYEPGSLGGQELLAHELPHVVQQNDGLAVKVQSKHASEQAYASVVQREGEFSDRPPTGFEAGAHALYEHDAMGEFLAGSSLRMLETQTTLQEANPESQEQAEQYQEQIENLLRLNAIGLMASHKATIEGRRSAMLSSQAGESRVKPLRDTASNIQELEQVQERLEEYKSNLKSVETKFFQRGGFLRLFTGNDGLNDALDDLGLNSSRYMPSSERRDMIKRYEAVLESGSRDRMWLFVYGSAQYMQQKRKSQIDAVNAALNLIFQNFPVFSQLEAKDVVEGDYASDGALEKAAQESFGKVLIAIDDTIRDIHSEDKDPLDMPKVIQTTRQDLPEPLKQVLDDMKASHQQFEFWRDVGLTAAEIAVAFIPVIGPALALGIGAASLAIQGEELIDQMEMADVGANPYGDNPLGVSGPSAFEKTMFGVTAVLSIAGLGSVANSLRGGRAAANTMEEAAEVAIRGSDDIAESGVSVADDIAEGSARKGDSASPRGTSDTPHSQASTTRLSDETHTVQFRDGAIHVCSNCGELDDKLTKVLRILPESHINRRYVTELRRDVRRTNREFNAGNLTQTELDEQVALFAERLERIAGDDPVLPQLLRMSSDELAENFDELAHTAMRDHERRQAILEEYAERQRDARAQSEGQFVDEPNRFGRSEELVPDQRRPTTGEWDGTPGDSNWTPDDLEAWSDIGYGIVPYRNGYPDFSAFIHSGKGIGEVTVPITRFRGATRTEHFAFCDEIFARRMGWIHPNGRGIISRAESYRSSHKLTWHHVENSERLQLVPRSIHEAAQHAGGISTAAH